MLPTVNGSAHDARITLLDVLIWRAYGGPRIRIIVKPPSNGSTIR